jgi:hypothetical protein
MNGNYKKGLIINDDVLNQAPDFNEPHFIKAQKLLFGFEDTKGANKCIFMILETGSECGVLHR